MKTFLLSVFFLTSVFFFIFVKTTKAETLFDNYTALPNEPILDRPPLHTVGCQYPGLIDFSDDSQVFDQQNYPLPNSGYLTKLTLNLGTSCSRDPISDKDKYPTIFLYTDKNLHIGEAKNTTYEDIWNNAVNNNSYTPTTFYFEPGIDLSKEKIVYFLNLFGLAGHIYAQRSLVNILGTNSYYCNSWCHAQGFAYANYNMSMLFKMEDQSNQNNTSILTTIIKTNNSDDNFKISLKKMLPSSTTTEIFSIDLTTQNFSTSSTSQIEPNSKYLLTQENFQNWQLTGVECTSNSPLDIFSSIRHGIMLSISDASQIKCTFTNKKNNIPILIIPGIMGTELKKDSDTLWPNVVKMINPLHDDTFMDPLAFDSNAIPKP